jgi:hypothetical protein
MLCLNNLIFSLVIYQVLEGPNSFLKFYHSNLQPSYYNHLKVYHATLVNF